jgi:hypothetical protein
MHKSATPGIAVATVLTAVAILAALAAPAGAQLGIPSFGVPVTENFNTLANSGTSSVLPTGWAFAETGPNADLFYRAGTGSLTTGDTYSFGATASSERAFGGLRSSNLVPFIGAALRNDTGGVIAMLDISFTGEQWRLGATPRIQPDRIFFEYSLNATDLTTGAWTAVTALDFLSPITSGVVGALDGNAAANRGVVSGSVTGILLAPTAVIWIRWSDFDVTGADDGLAIDDVSITAHEGPVPTVPTTLGAVKGAYR